MCNHQTLFLLFFPESKHNLCQCFSSIDPSFITQILNIGNFSESVIKVLPFKILYFNFHVFGLSFYTFIMLNQSSVIFLY